MYIVEGNIGAGKSTLLTLLNKTCPSITVIQEPVENWTGKDYGISLLERFYQQPNRWAYTMETLTMIQRSREHQKIQNQALPYKVMERSIYSGHYCFALNGYEHGYFNSVEWAIYHQWVEFFFTQQCKAPQGFIYIKTSPTTCNDRVKKRKRESESMISLKYLEQIHHKHEQFLIGKEGVFNNLKHVPVLVLDGNEDFEKDSDVLQEYAQKIKEFVKVA